MRVRACPHCRAALPESGRCGACGGWWITPGEIEAAAPGGLAPLRRLAGKGPLTHLNCAECGFALKSLDVPGPVYEGDLFWGLEAPRPSGTCVVEACARCGGVFADAANLHRAHGESSLLSNLKRVAEHAS